MTPNRRVASTTVLVTSLLFAGPLVHGFGVYETTTKATTVAAKRPMSSGASSRNQQLKQSSRWLEETTLVDIAVPFEPMLHFLNPPWHGESASPATVRNSATLHEQAAEPADIFNAPMFTKKRSMSEMAALSILGGALAVGIIATLANTVGAQLVERSEGRTVFVVEAVEDVGANIVDAAFPLSASEAVTGALGEATAGITAAMTSLFLSWFVSDLNMFNSRSSEQKTDQADENAPSIDSLFPESESASFRLQSGVEQQQQQQFESQDLRRKAVTNTDFFVSQAAARPVLETLGIPPTAVMFGSVLFAAIPAEIVNFAAVRRIEGERQRLKSILEMEEAKRKELEKPFPFNLLFPTTAADVSSALQQEAPPPRPKQVLSLKETIVVDIIADLIKWLGYGVLMDQYAGSLSYNGLPVFPGLESAWFGVIAALSAQIYTDVFLAVFGFGGETKRNQILSRSVVRWVTRYLQEIISATVLFGVYDIAQIPAKAMISSVLSGAAQDCYGSEDYDFCVQVYETINAPDASPEAQLRALVTTTVSLWNRYLP